MNILIIAEAELIIKDDATAQLRISAVLLRKAGRLDVPYTLKLRREKILMIESILETIFLCIIIISLALSFIQYIGIKVDTKTYEPEITYIGDYVQSVIIFLAISSLGLLIYVYIYFNNMKSLAWYDSGLLFIVYSAVTGFIINIIYSVIMNIIKFFDKTKSTYFLKDYEKNWTWILVMLAYQIYYLCNQLYTYGFAYLALILSYFFWMNPTKLAFEEKISEFKSLTRSYWCSFLPTTQMRL